MDLNDKSDIIYFTLKNHFTDKKGIFNQEQFIDLLIPCIKKHILRPRFQLLVLLEERIFKFIQHPSKTQAESEIEKWIMRFDNGFRKSMVENKIPKEIDNILKKYFNKTTIELLTEYQDLGDTSKYENKVEYKIKEWLKPQKEITIIDSKPDNDKNNFLSVESNRIDWKRQSFISSYAKEDIPEHLEKIQKRVDLKYIDSIPEIIKEDQDRFKQIYKAYSSNSLNKIVIPENTKNTIEYLWYGDPRKIDPNTFVGFSKTRDDFSLKIKNRYISSSISRLILQSYIVGLILGVNLSVIYRIFLEVVKENPTKYSGYTSSTGYVYDKKNNLPNKNIEVIINTILGNIEINPVISYIRGNWENLKYPKIDVSDLIKFVQTEIKDESKAYLIISDILEYYEDHGQGISIEKFATGLHSDKLIDKKKNYPGNTLIIYNIKKYLKYITD